MEIKKLPHYSILIIVLLNSEHPEIFFISVGTLFGPASAFESAFPRERAALDV